MPVVKNKAQRTVPAAGVELRPGFNFVTHAQLGAIAADPFAGGMIRERKPRLVVLDVLPAALGVLVHDARVDPVEVDEPVEIDEPVSDPEFSAVEED